MKRETQTVNIEYTIESFYNEGDETGLLVEAEADVLVEREANYGADADGNRGVTRTTVTIIGDIIVTEAETGDDITSLVRDKFKKDWTKIMEALYDAAD